MFFQDAFKTSRVHKDKGHEALFMTAGEFTLSNRWKGPTFPAILPLLCYNKRSKSSLQNNSLLHEITPFMLELANGIDVGEYRVFGYIGGVLGDLPGRTEFGTEAGYLTCQLMALCS